MCGVWSLVEPPLVTTEVGSHRRVVWSPANNPEGNSAGGVSLYSVGKQVGKEVHCDNEATVTALKTGYSRDLVFVEIVIRYKSMVSD